MKIYNNAAETIGNTPIVKFGAYSEKSGVNANILAKLEYRNPAGSAKDRVGFEMLRSAWDEGKINKNSVIIEPTSGNTGIGIASVAAQMGLKVIITMPETMSIERRKLLSAYGAELVLTDGTKGMAGAIEKANELAKEIPDSFIPAQFDNPANCMAHYKTTGPEIWSDTDGRVDIFVAGVGTGGTITGVGRFLKEKNPKEEIMENILFKQSFRGFDRNQVLEYIDNLSNEMSRQADNYNQIQKGLEEEIKRLEPSQIDSVYENALKGDIESILEILRNSIN